MRATLDMNVLMQDLTSHVRSSTELAFYGDLESQ